MNTRIKRFIALLLVYTMALFLYAQSPDQTPSPGLDIRVNVTNIVVPVAVYDRDGNVVNGLQPRNFRVYDNNKEQDVAVDVNYHPISLVVAVQCSAMVESILPQLKRVGSMLESLVVGDQGEVAVLAFDHRFMVKQDFTNDVTKISDGLKQIRPGSSSSRLIDASAYAIRMLRGRPANRRRVLLIMSETRDVASEGKLRESVLDAQLANVSVYTINLSRAVATLMYAGQPPRVDQMPPAARSGSVPSNVVATPTTLVQMGNSPGDSANFIPLLVELFKDTKAVFRDNPAEALTKATGGQEFAFIKQKTLEEAIAKIGNELHSQYLITYNPNNKIEGGYHEIKVEIEGNRGEWKVRARPGYWLAGVPN